MEKTYDEGLNDAWELAAKVLGIKEKGIKFSEIRELFESKNAEDIFLDYTAKEVLEKIQKEEKKIRRGDQVRLTYGNIGVVMSVYGNTSKIWMANGSEIIKNCDCIQKTGRTIDVDELLSMISEG